LSYFIISIAEDFRLLREIHVWEGVYCPILSGFLLRKNLIYLKLKEELGTRSLLRINIYTSFKELTNLLTDVKPESNAPAIDSFLLLELTEKLKQLGLVLLWYAISIILDIDHDVVVLVLPCYVLSSNFDIAIPLCELEGIG
jgi:hypothetical protein